MMKKALSILLVLLMAFSAVACTAAAPAEPEQGVFARGAAQRGMGLLLHRLGSHDRHARPHPAGQHPPV